MNELVRYSEADMAELNEGISPLMPRFDLIKVYQRDPNDPDKEEMPFGTFFIGNQDKTKTPVGTKLQGVILKKSEYLKNGSEGLYSNQIWDRHDIRIYSGDKKIVVSGDYSATGAIKELRDQYKLSYYTRLYVYIEELNTVKRIEVSAISSANWFDYSKLFTFSRPISTIETIFETQKSTKINKKTNKPFSQHEIKFTKGKEYELSYALEKKRELNKLLDMFARSTGGVSKSKEDISPRASQTGDDREPPPETEEAEIEPGLLAIPF